MVSSVDMTATDAHRTIDAVWRIESARLIAGLTRLVRDLGLAEELAQEGTVTMPVQETFWAKRFGMCTDRFGIPWMVNCAKPLEAAVGPGRRSAA